MRLAWDWVSRVQPQQMRGGSPHSPAEMQDGCRPPTAAYERVGPYASDAWCLGDRAHSTVAGGSVSCSRVMLESRSDEPTFRCLRTLHLALFHSADRATERSVRTSMLKACGQCLDLWMSVVRPLYPQHNRSGLPRELRAEDVSRRPHGRDESAATAW